VKTLDPTKIKRVQFLIQWPFEDAAMGFLIALLRIFGGGTT